MSIQLRRGDKFQVYGFFPLLGWTIFMIILLAWNCMQIDDNVQEEALITLQMVAERDLTFRAWTAAHGGVYVPISTKGEPNPFMTFIEDRDVVTEDGKGLTLFNPAYIMRQIYQDDLENLGIYGRLVGRNPTNPSNAADPWELEALYTFAKNPNLTELSEITTFNDEPSIRLIKPFYIKADCLKCHAHQGYEIGDLRGGISSARSLKPFLAVKKSRQLALFLGYGAIWFVGAIGIHISMKNLDKAADNLRKNEVRNRAMIEAIPDLIFRYNKEGILLDAEIRESSVMGSLIKKHSQNSTLVGKQIEAIFPQDIAATLKKAIHEVVTSGEMQILEHALNTEQGQLYLEERLVLEGKDEVIAIVRDITTAKINEARLKYLSFHDELTGLYNRHYFDNELKRLNASRMHPIGVIYADVNGLKQTNDNFGHAAGDRLLKTAASILKQSLRSSDVLARIGGDEFVALLPYTDEEQTKKIVKRMQNSIREHAKKQPEQNLSVALGAATAKTRDDDLFLTCRLADDRMYEDKRKRRI